MYEFFLNNKKECINFGETKMLVKIGDLMMTP